VSTPSEALPGAPPTALREIDQLPHPPGLPWLGNTLQIDKPHVHQQVEGWARRYGDFFTISIGGHRLLVVADHKAMGAVLRDRPEGFRRTPRFASIAREIGLGSGVFGAEGEVWKRQRRMVMAGFDPRHLRAYFPSLVRCCDRLEGRWRKAAAADAAIDLQADLMRFTVDAISGLAFGADVNTLESDEDIIQRHLDKIFPAMFRRLFAPFPTWRWYKTRADRALDASVLQVNAAIDAFVAAARKRLEDPARRAAPANLLEAMIVAADDPGSDITDGEVSGNVMTMLLAGEDTTANTLAWAIWLLSTHPEALARARVEVDALGEPATWTHERFAAMRWLEACANETMRLKPVAPSLTLQCLRDATVADIRVPAGTLLFLAMRSDSLREAYFERAAAFSPERWLDPASGPDATSASRVSMPFGAGPRVCPGRHLAMLEMKMALATLLGRFEIARIDAPGRSEPDERMSFAMGPSRLSMRLRPRTGAAS
jgi:cytochrome P450